MTDALAKRKGTTKARTTGEGVMRARKKALIVVELVPGAVEKMTMDSLKRSGKLTEEIARIPSMKA